ncbi:MAG: methylated-DNA--[protein]-cysteine S-methyltransferase [Thermodesulfobacteriota bacterium]
MPPRKNHPKESITTQAVMETPVGLVFLCFSATGLQRLIMAGEHEFREGVAIGYTDETQSLPPGRLKTWHDQVAQALDDYFAGQPADFAALPLDLRGAPFHLRVWQELRKIPPGETVSYQEVARRLGNPKGSRAVGQACGANPIPLIVPCHRVIAANGGLGGFSSGLPRKRWLLEHERVK